jgi:hypothetical protein
MDLDGLPWGTAKRMSAADAETAARRGWIVAAMVCQECGRSLGFVTRDREDGTYRVEVHFPAPLTSGGIAYLGTMALVDDDFRPQLDAKSGRRFDRWVERRTLVLDAFWQEPLDPSMMIPVRCERHGMQAVALADVHAAITAHRPGDRARRLAAAPVGPGG